MLSEGFGSLLKNARKQLNLSREELAARAGVSPRLVAELERGQSPNVSLESALRLLKLVGVSVVARAPNGDSAEIRGRCAAKLSRAARAEHRRTTWKGRHVLLHDSGHDPIPMRLKAKRVISVAQVSKQAYVIAASGRAHSPGTKSTRPSRCVDRSAAQTTIRSRQTSLTLSSVSTSRRSSMCSLEGTHWACMASYARLATSTSSAKCGKERCRLKAKSKRCE